MEIADYVGEFLNAELVENKSYLHRTKYFKYVLGSDIVFPVIDLEKYYEEGRNYIVKIQDTLIAALEILKQLKISSGRCKTPICILFLKSDYLSKVDGREERILNDFDDLLTYVKNHYKYYEKFFISAISSVPLKEN